ncbi:MAG: hypothetical protein RDV48_30855 [Candidatus Eremiobacteraeota bacterium]|nr:hypothetical protein [Candidatus Eremiobacteraeota bacterium]
MKLSGWQGQQNRRSSKSHKEKQIDLFKHATHMKEGPVEIKIPHFHLEMVFGRLFEKLRSEQIYLLDQALAAHRIPYFTSLVSKGHALDIVINQGQAEAVRAIIDELQKSPDHIVRITSRIGDWCELEPQGLPRHLMSHQWEFAVYYEYPDNLDFSLRKTEFLFTNNSRTVFGIREWYGDDRPNHNALGKMATKIIMDEKFRNTLISADPNLQLKWKDR